MSGEARLLFVVSGDYGELSNALGLVQGHPFQARLLLPDRLLSSNRGRVPVAAERWASIDDVLARVAADDPDVVFLFSAYLYAVNGLLDVADVERLIASLRARGRPVVTSDPFLGVLARLDASTFSETHPRRAWLMEHFGRLARATAGLPHLYHVPVDAPGVRAVSFFNPNVVVDAAEIAARVARVAPWAALRPPRPRWLFVLSHEDWGAQAARHGRAAFERLLAVKLAETARAGRQPVLVAPPAVVDAVRGHAALVEGLTLVAFTSHDVFTALGLDAEHAFYWNVFSNSIPPRVLNHRPVFFFDAGHMVQAIPGLAGPGLARYWAGVPPAYLDIGVPLHAATLSALAAEQDRAMEPARERFRGAMRPGALIDALRGAAVTQ